MRGAAFAALLVFGFFLPLEKTFEFSVGTLSRLIGFGVLGLAAASLVTREGLRLRKPSYFLLAMALFVFWNILSFFWSINPDDTLGRAETYAQLLAMTWIVWELVRTDSERFALLQAYVLGALASTGTALANFLAGDTQGEFLRFAGSGFDPNDYATTLALGIPMAWYLVTSGAHRRFYWLNLAYLPAALFAIVLTASRGGLVIALVSLSVIPLTYHTLTFGRKAGFVLFLTLVVAVPALRLGQEIYAQLTPNVSRLQTLSSEVSSGDFNYRTVIWGVGYDLVKARPLLGVGSGTFPQAAGPRLDRPRRPHNAYLAVASETGLIGLALFLILFLLAVLPVLGLGAPHRAVYLVLLATLALGLMPLNWETRKPTYFVLALLTTHRAFVLERPRPRLEPVGVRA